jgi:antitoxin component of RelBE/YafQ-DinJ toxin-antitoxin module
MRRRKPSKPDAIVQVNLRIDEQLRRQLEAAAKERHVAFSQEVRLRLTKANQSLAGYMADFERNVRDVIEHNVRNSKDIEATWRRLADLRTKIAHFQTGVEEVLLPYLQDPKVRELVRGTPQEREKGGKS